jgi:SAM-dependent methyltransferase
MGARARAAARKAAEGHTRLHLGCGLIAPPTWLNVDGSWNARLNRHPRAKAVLARLGVLPGSLAEMPWAGDVVIHDLRKPLPWDDGQFEAVYASHLLEHLTWGDAAQLLRESRRVLAPGGACRIVVPDLQFFVSDYQSRSSEPIVPGCFPAEATVTNADAFVQNLGFESPIPRAGGIAIRTYAKLFDYHHHKWMYDEESLAVQMRAAGFVNVRRCGFNDSQIANLTDVELELRVVPDGLACEGVVPE